MSVSLTWCRFPPLALGHVLMQWMGLREGLCCTGQENDRIKSSAWSKCKLINNLKAEGAQGCATDGPNGNRDLRLGRIDI